LSKTRPVEADGKVGRGAERRERRIALMSPG
jgi:hypothetical protein